MKFWAMAGSFAAFAAYWLTPISTWWPTPIADAMGFVVALLFGCAIVVAAWHVLTAATRWAWVRSGVGRYVAAPLDNAMERSHPAVRRLYASMRNLRRGDAAQNARTAAGRLPLLWSAYVIFGLVNLTHAAVRSYGDQIAPFGPFNTAAFEETLFGGIPSIWLQDVLGTGEDAWSFAGYVVWQSFFWVPLLAVLVVFARFGLSGAVRFIAVHAAVILCADVIYLTAPTEPPWVSVEAARMLTLYADGFISLDRNHLAALPSLHVALPAVYTIWFARLPASRLRWAAAPLAMWTLAQSWSVVYMGEHYVVDVLTGMAWAALIYAACERLGIAHGRAHAWRRRREAPAAPVPVAGARRSPAPVEEEAA